ncbi:Short-chain dehydrogenase [Anaerocolumna jejuensis DSM 15929]|uniref:Short-chain dehydrogenase n=1 Tax=Anaerocolumna jejuensis DSM 15929 TaxID=1121322 RepID=A0A1M7C8G9_9FIRM|nr:SDR family NAD(P)-dependent oxidoreductase [Anaerocolumna jejuensis]SHL63504.1 Short-chain dehydrogenase [Anaerocolumna jejuensis DSM 15929]
MNKKIILITGANSGIGKETAMTLAKEGHTVIIHGRNIEKTKKVCEEIKNVSHNQNIDMVCADLSIMSNIPKIVAELESRYNSLDVLINNAGGQYGNTREVTSEGHEKTMAINVLAPFLLTKLLLPMLQKSKSARVVTVSSASYSVGKFDAKDIELNDGYSLTRSYGLSKRYVYWIMQKFAQSGIDGVTFNTVEPGSADSDLGRVSRNGKLANLVYYLWKPMMWSMDRAAATSIYMAVSDNLEGVSGRFYGNLKEKNIKSKFRIQSEIDEVWNYCNKICKDFLASC